MAFIRTPGQRSLTTTNSNAQQQHRMSTTLGGLGFNASHDDDEEDDDRSSAISLTFLTPLIITGDNNHVSVDPSTIAQKVVMAVVTALKQMSMTSAGVPMIDEDGRPREIKITVKAETRIEGSKNVVGERAILGPVTGNGVATKKEDEMGSGPTIKRERDEDESTENEAKRTRVE